MASKNIESLYSTLFSMRTTMEDLVQEAQGVVNMANNFGGEINRVLSEQIKKYYIPAMQKLIDDTKTAGSLKGIIMFLDSVPLAYTRVEPQAESVTPDLPEVQLAEPAGTTDEAHAPMTAEPPYKASYRNPEGEAPAEEEAPVVQESLKRQQESVEVYKVIRTYKVGNCDLPVEDCLKDEEVAEFDTKEEADECVEVMEGTVTPAEKASRGTAYKVVKKEIPCADLPKSDPKLYKKLSKEFQEKEQARANRLMERK